MSNLKSVILLIRPHQWLKNGFIFLPLFFGGHLFNLDAWINGCITFVAFSLMASSVYCINDLKDVEADKRHPKKCKRPIASGAVSKNSAAIISVLLVTASISISFFMLDVGANVLVSGTLGTYFILNIAYCFKLKYISIVDVFIIAIGFVLRILGGGIAENIALSPWIVILTFLLALFLAFAKRRDDVVMNEKDCVVVRRSTAGYDLQFMNATLSIIAAVTMVSYLMYTVSSEVMDRLGSQYVYISSIFVLAGILRYLQITLVYKRSGSPTKVLMRDHFIKLTIVLWLLFFVIILYLR